VLRGIWNSTKNDKFKNKIEEKKNTNKIDTHEIDELKNKLNITKQQLEEKDKTIQTLKNRQTEKENKQQKDNERVEEYSKKVQIIGQEKYKIENENITCVRTYDDLIASGRSKFRQLLSLLGKDWKGVFKENTQNDEGGGNSDGSSTNPKLTLTQKQNDSKLKITKEDSIQTIAAKIQNSF